MTLHDTQLSFLVKNYNIFVYVRECEVNQNSLYAINFDTQLTLVMWLWINNFQLIQGEVVWCDANVWMAGTWIKKLVFSTANSASRLKPQCIVMPGDKLLNSKQVPKLPNFFSSHTLTRYNIISLWNTTEDNPLFPVLVFGLLQHYLQLAYICVAQKYKLRFMLKR